MLEDMRCLGLEELVSDEEIYENFVYDILNTGREIRGYSGNSYFIKNYGSAEFVVRTEYHPDKRKMTILDVDPHTQGLCVWDVRLSGLEADPKGADVMRKRVLVHHAETGKGMAMVNLVNADVLPGFMADDLLRMQIVGLARSIEYYASEEEYINSIPEPDIDYRMIPADGLVLANGYLKNRDPDSPKYGKRPELEDINFVRGIVTNLMFGTFDASDGDEEPLRTYIRCFIETEFGTLEIEHTIDQVREEQQDNIEVGATVIAGVVLSGDVAIDEYEYGIVKDEEHDLRLLRYSLIKGPFSRFFTRVADDCAYISDVSGKEFIGKNDIEKYMRYVKQSVGHSLYVSMAVLAGSPDESGEYPVGRKCLALAYDGPEKYEQVLFLDHDESGLITRIVLISDDRISESRG